MVAEKNKKIIEGEIIDEKQEAPETRQYVSEKIVGLVVLVLVLIIAGYFAYGPVKTWVAGFFGDEEPAVSAGAGPDEDEALRAEIEALQRRLAALETPLPAETPDFEARFKALEEAISALGESRPANGEGAAAQPDPRVEALIGEVTALREEMAKKEAEKPGTSATYAQALATLSLPLYESRPYHGQLEQVRILVLDMPALAQATLAGPLSVLSAQAQTGIPALEALRRDFEAASFEALKVEGVGEDAGWWAKTWARLKGVVVIRRTDGVSGSDLEKTLAAARQQLDAADLPATIAILSALPAAEGEAFTNWLGMAQKRQEALAAFGELIEFVPRSSPRGDAE